MGRFSRGRPYRRTSSKVWSSRITKRAKCRLSNRSKGTTGLPAFTRPGAKFMVETKALSPPTDLGSSRAVTIKLDWDVMSYLVARLELKTEIDQTLLCPIDLAEIEVGA